MTRVLVVANPTTYRDGARLRHAVRFAMSRHGWNEPLWLETTRDDPAGGMARTAVRTQADLVLAIGGDGTVTACAAVLAGTGVPLAILPTGTGNLLARNLGLPLALEDALAVACTGTDRCLDMGTANGRPFLVMAGVGFDARALDSGAPLKPRLGWTAYYLAALRHLGDEPMQVTLQADDGVPTRRHASALVIGNVGALPGGVPLLPRARPDDGLLDAVLLTAQGLMSWTAVGTQVLLRRATGRVARLTFRQLRIDLASRQPWQLDGEAMGSTHQLVIAVEPGQLMLRGPAR